MTRRRLTLLVLLAAGFFAVQAGEYSTWDWYQLRQERSLERERIGALAREVDSLEREAVAAETDPAVQERLARELYGMIREGEYSYQIIWDSAGTRNGGRP
ncbi:MAG TPA: septum formation initiator family protein [Gemmatimonadales bacterium]|nr:septum formation initiator family protein [Gemmatimonadales bacterium]